MTTHQSEDPAAGTAARPLMRQVVLDCSHPRALAEFYQALLGYVYRPGDEPPPPGKPDPLGSDWLVLRPEGADADSGRGLAFQQTDDYRPPARDQPGGAADPEGQRQMLHLDLTVPDAQSLARQRDRAIRLGAMILLDRSEDEDEPLHVFADPAGHPFCIFVA